MSEGLIPGPVRLAEILAALPPSPPAASAIERQAGEQSFEDWLKIAAHNSRQEQRVAELRHDLEWVLGERLERELSAALAKRPVSIATQKRYAQDLSRWKKWCAEVGVSPLPAPPKSFAAFLLDTCAGEGEFPKPAMMARFCAAVRLRHQVAGLLDPTQSVYVKAVRKWIESSVPQIPAPPAAEPPDQSH